MPNHKSAAKSLKSSNKKRLVNRMRISEIKTRVTNFLKQLNAFRAQVASGFTPSAEDILTIRQAFDKVQSRVMKGVGKRVLKLNTASRIVSKYNHKLKEVVDKFDVQVAK